MPADKCKLPPYMPDDPLTWFCGVESAFQIHKVMEQKDMATLVAHYLPQKADADYRLPAGGAH